MTLLQDGALSGNSLEMSNGAKCTSGGVWSNSCSGRLKNLDYEAQGNDILKKVLQLPIYVWNYKSNPAETHVNPTAEDFYDLFQSGTSKENLAAFDLTGVALASIKTLHELIDNQ